MSKIRFFLFLVTSSLLFQATASDNKRPLTLPDIMKFREIGAVSASENGQWMAYVQTPDRGDKSAHIVALNTEKSFDVPFGDKVVLNNDGSWAGMLIQPALLDMEKADKKQKKKLKTGGLLLDTSTGKRLEYERVKNIGFSGDNAYALVHFFEDEKKPQEKNSEDENADDKDKKHNEEENKHYLTDKELGSKALLVNLTTGKEVELDAVQKYQFAEDGAGLVYSIADKEGLNNRLVFLDTKSGKNTTLDQTVLGSYPHIVFSDSGNQLAYLKGNYSTKQAIRKHQLFIYGYGDKKASQIALESEDRFISHDSELSWSQDEKRLFFGQKPAASLVEDKDISIEAQEDLYNTGKITSKHSLLVWHGDDPRIKPHEQKQYENEQKRVYLGVYHVKRKRFVQLADSEVPDAKPTHNKKAIILSSDIPYRKSQTWMGRYSDFYYSDLYFGKRQLIEKHLSSSTVMHVSPSGRYVSYYSDGAIWLFDARNGNKTNLTKEIATSFANELHDYPYPAPGYGMAGWIEDDEAVLVYDRYDVWKLSPSGKAQNLTKQDGRKRRVEFRVVQQDPDQLYFAEDDTVLLKAYYDELKFFGMYELNLKTPAIPTKLIEDKKKYGFVLSPKNSKTILFTAEDMGQFPDIWMTKDNFSTSRKLTDVNPQIEQFLWGKPELVDWRSSKGKKLQGVLIKPANYVPGKRYPVLVYYYRYFSQRMYSFNQMKVNHRPNFPYYTGNGYAVFLPDIKFDIGTPGPSATDALVPGIQKLVDMGVADENAIGLHGHSWSGYQTAFVITQTDIFKAAVAGAPVSNMTSAYSGIRLGSGLARQFQYEQSQSRIGANLFEKLPLYIENSPVFFADRINTPLLIQFGDEDDAVPWQQGIELYLAMRRLDKPVIMLQYQGEPHHLKQYANKVDYTLKMKAFFDHHLKGQEAPAWMVDGVPYSDTSEEK